MVQDANGLSQSAGSTSGAAVTPETLRVALDHVTDAIVIFDADWDIRYANASAAELLGRPASELVGRNYFIVLPDAAGTSFHGFLLRARNASGPMSFRGVFARTNRPYIATAQRAGELLHLSFRQDPPRPNDADDAHHRRPEEIADRAWLRYLAEVSDALASAVDTAEAAKKLTQLVVPRLADWALVLLLDEQGHRREEAWTHRDPSAQRDLDLYLAGRRRTVREEELFMRALETGAPVHVPDLRVGRSPDATPPTEEARLAYERLDTRSLTGIPLQVRGEAFGALALMNDSSRDPHTEREIAAASEVTRRAALAIDNARLRDQRVQVAETLQLSLLAQPPEVDGLEIAVRYRPASSYQQVGGDWYDVFVHHGGVTSLVIGDVVGHNVDAAAAMSQIRSIVRGIACDHAGSPAQTLSRVDHVLTQLDVDALATASLAVIEPVDGAAEGGARVLRWSSAGHPPPVVVRADGTVGVLERPSDLLLGTGMADRRVTHKTTLEPGDTVLLYTDGIVELDRSDLDEGTARLVDGLGPLADLTPDDLCGRLLDSLAPGGTEDDIALLAVRTQVPDGHRSAPAFSPQGS